MLIEPAYSRLKLESSSNALLVSPGDDLTAKYNWLKSSDRDAKMGVLSTTNRRALILSPGTYALTAKLQIDTAFVDFVSLNPFKPQATTIYGNFADTLVELTALDVSLASFTIKSDNNSNKAFVADAANTGTCTTNLAGGNYYYVNAAGIGIAVAVNDEVYLSGAGVTDGWYPVIMADDDRIVVQGCGAASNINYTVISHQTKLSHLNFISPATGQISSPCWLAQHTGGIWQYCTAGNYSFVLAENKMFRGEMSFCSAGKYSFGGDNTGTELGGEFFRCFATERSFGGCDTFGCNVSATFRYCQAGERSFAMGKEFSGKAYDCIGGDRCFGGYSSGANYGIFSGYAEGCTASGKSFGSGNASCKNSGEMVNCEVTSMPDAMYCEGAKIINCELQITTANKSCIDLNDSNTKIYNSTLIANGTGSSITAGEAQNILALHCRTNKDKHANVTNKVGDGSLAAGYCIVDSDVE